MSSSSVIKKFAWCVGRVNEVGNLIKFSCFVEFIFVEHRKVTEGDAALFRSASLKILCKATWIRAPCSSESLRDDSTYGSSTYNTFPSIPLRARFMASSAICSLYSRRSGSGCAEKLPLHQGFLRMFGSRSALWQLSVNFSAFLLMIEQAKTAVNVPF